MEPRSTTQLHHALAVTSAVPSGLQGAAVCMRERKPTGASLRADRVPETSLMIALPGGVF